MTDPTDRLRRYGEDIASAVNPARSRVAAMRAIGQAQRIRSRRVPRLAFATVAMLVAANLVTVGVADAAVPGDPLYPLDRGYERVADVIGLGGDRTEERITEAEVLVSRDDHVRAIDLLAESVETDAVQGAVSALRAVDPSDPGLPAHVETLVERVHQLAEARREGQGEEAEEANAAVRLLALQVDQLARDSRPDRTGPPDRTPGEGPPDQVPGPTEREGGDDAGPGGGQGPSDGAGPADTAPGPPTSVPAGGGGRQQDGPGRDGDEIPAEGTQQPGPPGGGSPGATNPGRGGGGR